MEGDPVAGAPQLMDTDSEEDETERQDRKARRRKSPHHRSETSRLGAQLRASAPRFSRARKGASTPRSRPHSSDQAGEQEEEEISQQQAGLTTAVGVDLDELERAPAQQQMQPPSTTDPTALLWTRSSKGSPRLKTSTSKDTEE